MNVTLEDILVELAGLRTEVTGLRRENAQFQAKVSELTAENAELRRRLEQTSQTSDKPPSSDSPRARAERRKKKPTGRKRGGQPGHAGHSRELLEPTQVRALHPESCGSCGQDLSTQPDLPRTTLHQVVDLPERIEPVVTHVLQHRRACPQCHRITCAPRPADVPTTGFGPRLQALLSTLTGSYHLSRRQTQALVQELLGVKVSLGTVSSLEARTSQALQPVHTDLKADALQSAVLHVDETSFGLGLGKMGWLWTAVGGQSVVFALEPHRSRAAFASLVGSTSAVIVSDRYSAYAQVPADRHQLCWAHAVRNFEALSRRPGIEGEVGREVGELVHQVLSFARL